MPGNTHGCQGIPMDAREYPWITTSEQVFTFLVDEIEIYLNKKQK